MPIVWGTYGDRIEKGYLHSWGEEWMDYSADSLAIQVKTEPIRYRRLAWLVLQDDTLRAPINWTRLDSMAQAKGIPLPPRAAARAKPAVEKAPADPDILPKGIAAALGGGILIGVGGQYAYHCEESLCGESLGKQIISGTSVVTGTVLLGVGVWWIVDAIRSAK
jgi:hypothetical protein